MRKLGAVLLTDEPDPLISKLAPDWPHAGAVPFGFGEMSGLRRRKLGLTQAELAVLVGVNVATISRFERNMPNRDFYRTEQHPIDGPMLRLKSQKLAEGLRFNTIAEHEEWCDDPRNATWEA